MKPIVCKYCSAINKHYSFQCPRKPPKKVGDIEEMSYEEYKAKRSSVRKVKIKPISDKQSSRLKAYRIARDAYMNVYTTCEFPECNNKSTDLHHGSGRVGDLLTNTKYFVALCRLHHDWVELHPNEAKELGLSFNRLDK